MLELNAVFCYLRHAIAADEYRVKFLPELVCGGASVPQERQEVDEAGVPRVKEVYFPGSHSDMYANPVLGLSLTYSQTHRGGGNVPNEDLNNASVVLQWIVNQSIFLGLRVQSPKVEWNWQKLEDMRPKNPMTPLFRIIEMIPFTQLTYKNSTHTAWYVEVHY